MSAIEIRCSCLLFDLDGVLVDSRRCVESIWVRWGDEHGIDPQMIIQRAHGRRTSEVIREMAPHLNVAEEVAAIDRIEETESNGIFAVPNAPELIASIPAGRWGIVTSCSVPVARLRMKIAGIPTPRVFVTSEDVARGKPSPDGYLLAAKKLGIEPGQCVVIEDAPAGIEAGKNADMRVIAVASSYDRSELTRADWIVDSLLLLSARADPTGMVVLIHDHPNSRPQPTDRRDCESGDTGKRA